MKSLPKNPTDFRDLASLLHVLAEEGMDSDPDFMSPYCADQLPTVKACADLQRKYDFTFEAYYRLLVLLPWEVANQRMARLVMHWLQYLLQLVPRNPALTAKEYTRLLRCRPQQVTTMLQVMEDERILAKCEAEGRVEYRVVVTKKKAERTEFLNER